MVGICVPPRCSVVGMATFKKSKWSVARTKVKASGAQQKPKLDAKKGLDKKKDKKKRKGLGQAL